MYIRSVEFDHSLGVEIREFGRRASATWRSVDLRFGKDGDVSTVARIGLRIIGNDRPVNSAEFRFEWVSDIEHCFDCSLDLHPERDQFGNAFLTHLRAEGLRIDKGVKRPAE